MGIMDPSMVYNKVRSRMCPPKLGDIQREYSNEMSQAADSKITNPKSSQDTPVPVDSSLVLNDLAKLIKKVHQTQKKQERLREILQKLREKSLHGSLQCSWVRQLANMFDKRHKT